MNMTVVYASDANYAKLTAISAVSLLRHNPGVRVVLLGYNLEEPARDLVRQCVEAHGGEFLYLDVSGEIAKLAGKGIPGYTSFAVYARIFIPWLIPGDGKIIYLDSDTLVNGSLREMLDVPLHGKALALAVDCVPCAYKKFIRVPRHQPYYNSGVMLIVPKAWREKRCCERFLEEAEHPHGPTVLVDQDIIVRAFPEFAGQTRPMSWDYRLQYWLHRLLPQWMFDFVGPMMTRANILRMYHV